MKNAAHHIRIITIVGVAFFCFASDLWGQNLPPLPDRQMEMARFGYRINGRFSFLWYPSQPKFRNEFTINAKVEKAFNDYLKVVYLDKGAKYLAVGCMASVFLFEHSEWSSGILIGIGSLTPIFTIPLTVKKNQRFEKALRLRNQAWYYKVRE